MNTTDAKLYLNPVNRKVHTDPNCASYKRAKYGHPVQASLWKGHVDLCSACAKRDVKRLLASI